MFCFLQVWYQINKKDAYTKTKYLTEDYNLYFVLQQDLIKNTEENIKEINFDQLY